MDTFRLAWRSFVRHRRRSLLTGLTVALGLAMMLVFVGIGDDVHQRMAESGIRLGAGHVLVQARGYQDNQTLEYLVEGPDAVLAAATSLPHVRAVVPRVHASGFLSSGVASAAVAVAGVDPHREPTASDLPGRRRAAGDYLRTRAELPFQGLAADIYLGVELARTLRVEVGDRVVLNLSGRDGRLVSAAYLVRGLFRSGVLELDSSYAEVPIEEAQAQLRLGGRVTQVAVLLDRLDATAAVTAALERALAGGEALEVLPWQVALHELYDAIRLDDLGLYLTAAIVFIIVAAGIFNTLLMSVIERTREMGVMLAIGTSRGRLFAQVLLESGVLAVAAALLGLGVGLGLHAWIAAHGIDITAWTGNYQVAGTVLDMRIHSRLTAPVVIRWTLIVMGLVVASALYPAWRVARLEPVEAMRHA